MDTLAGGSEQKQQAERPSKGGDAGTVEGRGWVGSLSDQWDKNTEITAEGEM